MYNRRTILASWIPIVIREIGKSVTNLNKKMDKSLLKKEKTGENSENQDGKMALGPLEHIIKMHIIMLNVIKKKFSDKDKKMIINLLKKHTKKGMQSVIKNKMDGQREFEQYFRDIEKLLEDLQKDEKKSSADIKSVDIKNKIEHFLNQIYSFEEKENHDKWKDYDVGH